MSLKVTSWSFFSFEGLDSFQSTSLGLLVNKMADGWWLCLSNSRPHYLSSHFGKLLSSTISGTAFWGLRESFKSPLMRIVISCPEFQLKFDHEHFLYISWETVANGWYYCSIPLCLFCGLPGSGRAVFLSPPLGKMTPKGNWYTLVPNHCSHKMEWEKESCVYRWSQAKYFALNWKCMWLEMPNSSWNTFASLKRTEEKNTLHMTLENQLSLQILSALRLFHSKTLTVFEIYWKES